MKKILSLFALSLLFLSASAQKVIEAPKFSAAFAGGIKIEKIVLTDTATVLHFDAQVWPGTWFRIASDTYLVDNGKKLVAKSISGMPFDKEYVPEGGKSKFSMTFPPVNPKTATIDFIESDCERCFRIIDIELTPSTTKPLLAAGLYGDWYKTDGSKEWVLTLNEKAVVYDSKVWSYNSAVATGDNVKVVLKNGKTLKTIYLQQNKPGELLTGENIKTLTALASEAVNKKYQPANDKGFSVAAFKPDSVDYVGYLHGYSPKLGYKTGKITVNNVVTGKQNSYLISITADGKFSAKFPMNYPGECYIEIGQTYGQVYLEPGEKLFHYINLNGWVKNLYMGGTVATVNRELETVRKIGSLDWNKMQQDIAEFTPQQYLAYFKENTARSLAELDKYKAENNISAKTYELAALNIKARNASQMLQYNNNHEYAYRRAHNISFEQRENATPRVVLDSAYMSFLNDVPVNEQISVVSGDYYSLINMLKYNDMVRDLSNIHYMRFYADELKAKPTLDTEQKLVLDTLENALKVGDGNVFQKAYRNHAKLFSDLYKAREDYLREKFMSSLNYLRNTELKRVVKKDISFALQLMDAQDEAQKIEQDFKPLDASALATVKSKFTYPLIATAFEQYNAGIKQRIERNKYKTGYVNNNVPKTAPDSVFAAIMSKYKGKAVYVDFWATWCAPCRGGIERIAPLKEEMKDENVVFVYITNPSSPEGTYKGMIPEIKGEHYRVSNDEWNMLSSKFNITGIPHYAVVDTKGVVVDAHAQLHTNDAVKAKLLELAKQK